MKKLFDRRVFFDTLKELIYIVILLLLIGILSLIATRNIISNRSSLERSVYAGIYQVYNLQGYNINNPALLIVMIFGSPFLSINALRFAWNRKRTDFSYSMPLTKGKLYTSKVLAVIFTQITLLLAISIAEVFISLEFIGSLTFVSDIIFGFINASICSLVIIGAIFLASSVTGKALSAAILSIGMLTFPFIFPISRYFSLVRHANYIDYLIMMRPSLYIFTNTLLTTDRLINFSRYLPGIIFSLFLGLGYIVTGYFLFKRRSGEITGVYTKNKLVRDIVMGVVSFAVVYLVILGLFEYSLYNIVNGSYDIKIIVCLIAVVILLLSYVVLAYKKIIRGNRYLLVFAVTFILAVVINCGIEVKVDRDSKIEINTDKVESVSIITQNEPNALLILYTGMSYPGSTRYVEIAEFWTLSYGQYISGDVKITDRTIIEELANGYNNREEQYKENQPDYFLRVKFNQKYGRAIYKNVPIYYNYDIEERKLLEENTHTKILSNKDYQNSYYHNMPLKNATQISYYDNVIDWNTWSSKMLNNDFDVLDKTAEEEMKKVYEVFCKEYDTLSTEQKISINVDYLSPYEYRIGLFENIGNNLNIGSLMVWGRIEGVDIADKYMIKTDDTPETAQAYIDAINKIGMQEFESIILGYEPGVESDFNNLKIYFITTEEYRDYYFHLQRKEEDAVCNEYFYKVIEFVKENDFSTPSINDIIIKLSYYDKNISDYKEMYLGVTDDELDELIEIYKEYQDYMDNEGDS